MIEYLYVVYTTTKIKIQILEFIKKPGVPTGTLPVSVGLGGLHL